jgi:hypothetical protein
MAADLALARVGVGSGGGVGGRPSCSHIVVAAATSPIIDCPTPSLAPPTGLPRLRRKVRERRKGEKMGKRKSDDVVTLTCGAHVGPTLTRLPRRTKPDTKPSKNLK